MVSYSLIVDLSCWFGCSLCRLVFLTSGVTQLRATVLKIFLCSGPLFCLRMAKEGSRVYFSLTVDGSTPQRTAGLIIEIEDTSAVVAVAERVVKGFSAAVVREGIGYLRLPTSALGLEKPSGWAKSVGADLPDLRKSRATWFGGEKTSLVSSEAEAPPGPVAKKSAAAASSKDVEKSLKDLESLWGGGQGSSEEEDSSESDAGAARVKPPGNGKKSKKGRKSKSEEGDHLRTALMMQLMGQSSGSSSGNMDLTPLLLMKLLDLDAGKSRKKKSRRQEDSSSGGSDSDVSGAEGRTKGMKAVKQLHAMQQKIVNRPRKIIREFEREVVEDLGVVGGQSWTLKDWVRRQPWNKFKGLQRCAFMDVAAIELLRQDQPDAACAQLIQNLKAKVQCTLQMGDWTAGWLMTGLPDPLAKKDFAGTKQEMSVISGYLSAVARLKKEVKEAELSTNQEEDDAAKK